MIRRASNVAPKRTGAGSTRQHRIAKARRFWLDLNARLGQAQKHGITLAEATRRLEQREAVAKRRRQSPGHKKRP
jgi:hypothetical protein